jgi:hypothetical protein
MSKNYNQTLQSNNTDLQDILNIINELPEASESGGFETCAVSVTFIDNPGSGQKPSHITYTTVEDDKIVNKVYYGEGLEWPKIIGGTPVYATGTINCIVGTSVYLYNDNIVGGDVITSDNITLKDDMVGVWESGYEAVIDNGSEGTIECVL